VLLNETLRFAASHLFQGPSPLFFLHVHHESHPGGIMKIKPLVAFGTLALAAGAALAQQAGTVPLSREEVRRQVLEARANGTLSHAGDAAPEEWTEYRAQLDAPSTLTRADLKAVVRQARAAGELAHAGPVAPEEEIKYARAHPWTPTLTRAEVKQAVLEARASGTLIPAGEGAFADGPLVARHTTYALRGSLERWNAARGH
jgi:hypothetical protein